ncbi:hypothetical protein [Streptomyces sp.]|uniref:hypothetical protein n=1 Tax=Streptomyces sp. TaxID=1931 RepID=UPI002D773528|nr:hypothetical protein [Streptomyces sp.]HET6356062.1 hypothetical protein [Streptomyces sp.]
MSTDEQATRAAGSVPNAYGNALAWRWSREMPTALRRGFLTLLYALRAMANANGELRFPDKPIRIQDIAKAAAVREKDARRYLDAAIAAGVVTVKGERRRGVATLYTLTIDPTPDWGAAEKVLNESRRPSGKGSAPWVEDDDSSGHRGPNQIGPPRPELEAPEAEGVRAPAAPMGSGPRGPNGSGPRGPNNPGITQELSQDGAEVVPQPQLVGAPGPHKIDPPQDQDQDTEPPRDFTRCASCHERMVPRPGRTTHTHCAPQPERTAS